MHHYSQDISQKSSGLLRLNLVLNDLAKSLQNVVQGNTLTDPAFKSPQGGLMQFDYIVSNPPFNLDFSDYRELLDSKERKQIYFAGVPTIPKKKKDGMAIYLCFIQHVVASLSGKGKAAIVVPSGFLTASAKSDKVAYGIRKGLVEKKWIRGVISMPSNIFGKTNTSVSVLIIDKTLTNDDSVVLIDATQLGHDEQVDGKKRHVISDEDEKLIVDTYKRRLTVDDFSIVTDYTALSECEYSYAAGRYFDVKIKHTPITNEEFQANLSNFVAALQAASVRSGELDKEIEKNLRRLIHG